MNERIPKIKKNPLNNNLQCVDISNRDVQHLLRDVNKACLDTDFCHQWKAVKVFMVHNADLEASYVKKRCELKENRSSQSIKENLGFLELHKSQREKIVRDGLQVHEQHFNRLGKGGCGVCLNRFFDVELKCSWVETGATVNRDIFVFKFVSGKCKTLPLNSVHSKSCCIDPTPNYDSHISSVQPKTSDSLFAQKVRSCIYLYEYTEDCEPSSCPRQCLPYAVITCMKVHNPPKPVTSSFSVKKINPAVKTGDSKTSKTEVGISSKPSSASECSLPSSHAPVSHTPVSGRTVSGGNSGRTKSSLKHSNPHQRGTTSLNKKRELSRNSVGEQEEYLERLANARKALQTEKDAKFSEIYSILPQQTTLPQPEEHFTKQPTYPQYCHGGENQDSSNSSVNQAQDQRKDFKLTPDLRQLENSRDPRLSKYKFDRNPSVPHNDDTQSATKSKPINQLRLVEHKFESDLASAVLDNQMARHRKKSKTSSFKNVISVGNEPNVPPIGADKTNQNFSLPSSSLPLPSAFKKEKRKSNEPETAPQQKENSDLVIKSTDNLPNLSHDHHENISSIPSNAPHFMKGRPPETSPMKKSETMSSSHCIKANHEQVEEVDLNNASILAGKSVLLATEDGDEQSHSKSNKKAPRTSITQGLPSSTSENQCWGKSSRKSKSLTKSSKDKNLLPLPVFNQDGTVSTVLRGIVDGAIQEIELSKKHSNSQKNHGKNKKEKVFVPKDQDKVPSGVSDNIFAKILSISDRLAGHGLREEAEKTDKTLNASMLPDDNAQTTKTPQGIEVEGNSSLSMAKVWSQSQSGQEIPNLKKAVMIKEIRDQTVGEIREALEECVVFQGANSPDAPVTMGRREKCLEMEMPGGNAVSVSDTDIQPLLHIPSSAVEQDNVGPPPAPTPLTQATESPLEPRGHAASESEVSDGSSPDEENGFPRAVPMQDLGITCYLAALSDSNYQPNVCLVDCCQVQKCDEETQGCKVCTRDRTPEVLNAKEETREVKRNHDNDQSDKDSNINCPLRIDLSPKPTADRDGRSPLPYVLQMHLSPVSSVDENSLPKRGDEMSSEYWSGPYCSMGKDEKVMQDRQFNVETHFNDKRYCGSDFHWPRPQWLPNTAWDNTVSNSSQDDSSSTNKYCGISDSPVLSEKENVPVSEGRRGDTGVPGEDVKGSFYSRDNGLSSEREENGLSSGKEENSGSHQRTLNEIEKRGEYNMVSSRSVVSESADTDETENAAKSVARKEKTQKGISLENVERGEESDSPDVDNEYCVNKFRGDHRQQERSVSLGKERCDFNTEDSLTQRRLSLLDSLKSKLNEMKKNEHQGCQGIEKEANVLGNEFEKLENERSVCSEGIGQTDKKVKNKVIQNESRNIFEKIANISKNERKIKDFRTTPEDFKCKEKKDMEGRCHRNTDRAKKDRTKRVSRDKRNSDNDKTCSNAEPTLDSFMKQDQNATHLSDRDAESQGRLVYEQEIEVKDQGGTRDVAKENAASCSIETQQASVGSLHDGQKSLCMPQRGEQRKEKTASKSHLGVNSENQRISNFRGDEHDSSTSPQNDLLQRSNQEISDDLMPSNSTARKVNEFSTWGDDTLRLSQQTPHNSSSPFNSESAMRTEIKIETEDSQKFNDIEIKQVKEELFFDSSNSGQSYSSASLNNTAQFSTLSPFSREGHSQFSQAQKSFPPLTKEERSLGDIDYRVQGFIDDRSHFQFNRASASTRNPPSISNHGNQQSATFFGKICENGDVDYRYSFAPAPGIQQLHTTCSPVNNPPQRPFTGSYALDRTPSSHSFQVTSHEEFSRSDGISEQFHRHQSSWNKCTEAAWNQEQLRSRQIVSNRQLSENIKNRHELRVNVPSMSTWSFPVSSSPRAIPGLDIDPGSLRSDSTEQCSPVDRNIGIMGEWKGKSISTSTNDSQKVFSQDYPESTSETSESERKIQELLKGFPMERFSSSSNLNARKCKKILNQFLLDHCNSALKTLSTTNTVDYESNEDSVKQRNEGFTKQVNGSQCEKAISTTDSDTQSDDVHSTPTKNVDKCIFDLCWEALKTVKRQANTKVNENEREHRNGQEVFTNRTVSEMPPQKPAEVGQLEIADDQNELARGHETGDTRVLPSGITLLSRQMDPRDHVNSPSYSSSSSSSLMKVDSSSKFSEAEKSHETFLRTQAISAEEKNFRQSLAPEPDPFHQTLSSQTEEGKSQLDHSHSPQKQVTEVKDVVQGSFSHDPGQNANEPQSTEQRECMPKSPSDFSIQERERNKKRKLQKGTNHFFIPNIIAQEHKSKYARKEKISGQGESDVSRSIKPEDLPSAVTCQYIDEVEFSEKSHKSHSRRISRESSEERIVFSKSSTKQGEPSKKRISPIDFTVSSKDNPSMPEYFPTDHRSNKLKRSTVKFHHQDELNEENPQYFIKNDPKSVKFASENHSPRGNKRSVQLFHSISAIEGPKKDMLEEKCSAGKDYLKRSVSLPSERQTSAEKQTSDEEKDAELSSLQSLLLKKEIDDSDIAKATDPSQMVFKPEYFSGDVEIISPCPSPPLGSNVNDGDIISSSFQAAKGAPKGVEESDNVQQSVTTDKADKSFVSDKDRAYDKSISDDKSSQGKGEILSDYPMEALSIARHVILDQLNSMQEPDEIQGPSSVKSEDADLPESEEEEGLIPDSPLSIITNDSSTKISLFPEKDSKGVEEDSDTCNGETKCPLFNNKVRDNIIITLSSQSESDSTPNIQGKLKDRSVFKPKTVDSHATIISDSDEGILPQRKVKLMMSSEIPIPDAYAKTSTPIAESRKKSHEDLSGCKESPVNPLYKYIVPKLCISLNDKDKETQSFSDHSSHSKRDRNSPSPHHSLHGRRSQDSFSLDHALTTTTSLSGSPISSNSDLLSQQCTDTPSPEPGRFNGRRKSPPGRYHEGHNRNGSNSPFSSHYRRDRIFSNPSSHSSHLSRYQRYSSSPQHGSSSDPRQDQSTSLDLSHVYREYQASPSPDRGSLKRKRSISRSPDDHYRKRRWSKNSHSPRRSRERRERSPSRVSRRYQDHRSRSRSSSSSYHRYNDSRGKNSSSPTHHRYHDRRDVNSSTTTTTTTTTDCRYSGSDMTLRNSSSPDHRHSRRGRKRSSSHDRMYRDRRSRSSTSPNGRYFERRDFNSSTSTTDYSRKYSDIEKTLESSFLPHHNHYTRRDRRFNSPDHDRHAGQRGRRTSSSPDNSRNYDSDTTITNSSSPDRKYRNASSYRGKISPSPDSYYRDRRGRNCSPDHRCKARSGRRRNTSSSDSLYWDRRDRSSSSPEQSYIARVDKFIKRTRR